MIIYALLSSNLIHTLCEKNLHLGSFEKPGTQKSEKEKTGISFYCWIRLGIELNNEMVTQYFIDSGWICQVYHAILYIYSYKHQILKYSVFNVKEELNEYSLIFLVFLVWFGFGLLVSAV